MRHFIMPAVFSFIVASIVIPIEPLYVVIGSFIILFGSMIIAGKL